MMLQPSKTGRRKRVKLKTFSEGIGSAINKDPLKVTVHSQRVCSNAGNRGEWGIRTPDL